MAALGTDFLFENHTIIEIQEIEKKLRNDIERKKEELRQMVGERYRDLMEAADTITEMKEVAESVTECVESIESKCLKLQNSGLQTDIFHLIQDKVAENERANELLYVVASQIKVLMDSPAKIWSFIESRDFLSAVSLYLLAGHSHSLLMLDPSYQELKIHSQFPVIYRQWVAISLFRSILMQNSKAVLESQEAEPLDVLGPLCCYCLLSNASLQQALLEYLNIRKILLKNIFQLDKSAKTQVCEFGKVVQITLQIIYAIFYPFKETSSTNEDERNLLYRSLRKLTNTMEPGPVSLLDLKSNEVFKFLPSSLKDFRPILSSLELCSAEFLQQKCNEWLEEIRSSLQPDLEELLNYVNSIKNLSLIRDALIESLFDIKHWDDLCNNLLNRSFSVWHFFLKDCFLKRIEVIIDGRMKAASEFCQKDIEETIYKLGFETLDSELKFERNISLYVWSESPQDITDNASWLPRHYRNYCNSGGLSMKSINISPKIQNICKDLDQRIQDVLEDISYFSCKQNRSLTHPFNKERSLSMHNFMTEINGENHVVYHYLTLAAKKYFTDLVNFIETTLAYIESENDTPEKSTRIIFIGHMCIGLANLCPHANATLLNEKPDDILDRNDEHVLRSSLSLTTEKESQLWKSLKERLLKISASTFSAWSKDQICNLISTIKSELMTDSPEGLYKILLQWDKIEIQEESELGNAINSVLRIPQHISTPVFNALFEFCCKLNTIGGFSINSDVKSALSKQLLIALLEVYNEKVSSNVDGFNPRLLQVQSLQLLFDVQFFMGLMVQKDNICETINNMSQEIINKAISHIDPFDMDVFSVPLQQNVKKALQKSASLFGLIASLNQVSYLSNFKSHSVSSQMEHNVMLVSAAGTRFPLLPLPSRTNTDFTSQEQFLPQPKEAEVNSRSSSPSLRARDTSPNPMKSTSFYEKMTAMSSSWFGN